MPRVKLRSKGSSLFHGSTTCNKEYLKFSLIKFFKILLITAVLPRNRLDPMKEGAIMNIIHTFILIGKFNQKVFFVEKLGLYKVRGYIPSKGFG